eukprot:PITA_36151
MALVSTTIFSILLNISPSRTFMPFRDLRQGDPLSPFLFVLMMEGLGRAIKTENAEGRIQGLKLTLDGVAFTHQQFVDDTMLQGIPTVREARAFKQILNDFAMVADTKVSKGSVTFKYLGIPLTDKPLSKEVWEPVTNKLQDKVRKWTCRSLNLAGLLVLTKVVLQAIPIFMFSALLAPKGVMQQIGSIQRDFLWGRGEEKKKWELVAWDKLCKPKYHGGLGIHDPETLSRVSGEKLWSRWLNELETPWAKLWKHKYANNW